MDHKNARLFDTSHEAYKDRFSKQLQNTIIACRWYSSVCSIYIVEIF